MSDTPHNTDAKVYPPAKGAFLSMTDMLAYFEKMGAMRVSDLHIKIGTQPPTASTATSSASKAEPSRNPLRKP
jgi:hypothetical protein